MRTLSLAHLTFLHLPPPALIHLAAEAGFESVGLRLIAVTPTTPGYPLMNDPQMMRATLRALKDTGVTVNDIEFLRLTPNVDIGSLEPFLVAGADLGAKHVVTAPYDPDLPRLTANLASLAERAAGFGLSPVLEFFPWTNVPDFTSAMKIAVATGNPSVGVLLDTLHFDRSGSRLADVAAADPARLPFLHLCDAPVQPPYSEEQLLRTARGARLIPGRGQIALPEIVAQMPEGIPVALELPMERGPAFCPDLQLARQIFEETQRFLDGCAA